MPQKSETDYDATCPDCSFLVAGERVPLPIDVTLPRSGEGWEGRQESDSGPVTVRLATAGAMVRVSVRGAGVDVTSELKRWSAEQNVAGAPAAVTVRLGRRSSVIGAIDRAIPAFVYLSDSAGRATVPNEDVDVQLAVRGGAFLEGTARREGMMTTLSRDAPSASRAVIVLAPDLAVTASASGIASTTAEAKGCRAVSTNSPLRVKMATPWGDTAPADGERPIRVTFSVVDDTDTLVTDNAAKDFDFMLSGVGRLADTATTPAQPPTVIAGGECVTERSVVASTAGYSTVSSTFRGMPQELLLVFEPVLSLLAVALAIAAGCAGGFVAAAQRYSAAIRWRAARWLYHLVSAGVAGGALYLALLFGLFMTSLPMPGGSGPVVLLGLVGGYSGASVLNRIESALWKAVSPASVSSS